MPTSFDGIPKKYWLLAFVVVPILVALITLAGSLLQRDPVDGAEPAATLERAAGDRTGRSPARAQEGEYELLVSNKSTDFAVKMDVKGSAIVSGTEISVDVDELALSLDEREAFPDATSVLEYVRVELVEAAEDGSWRVLVQSGKHFLDLALQPGQEKSVGPFAMTLPLNGVDSLVNKWLVFTVAERMEGLPQPEVVGFAHAHSSLDIF